MPEYHEPLVGLSKEKYEVTVNGDDAAWLEDQLKRYPEAFSLMGETISRLRLGLRNPSIPLRLNPLAAAWLYGRLREEMMDYADRNDHILMNDFQQRIDRLTTDFEFRLTTDHWSDNRRFLMHVDK